MFHIQSSPARFAHLTAARRTRVIVSLAGAACLLGGAGLAHAATPYAPQQWLATWTASPQELFAPGPELRAAPHVAGRTIRERMRVSVGGHELRVRISNAFGKVPLVIGSATIAVPTSPGSIEPGTLQTLTFNGQKTAWVPVGAPLISDPVKMDVPADSVVSISLYLPQKPGKMPLTLHKLGLLTAIISPPGDFTHDTKLPEASKTTASLFVTGLMVPRKSGQFTIVALGDSITDGNVSTVDAWRNWPDDFAMRLRNAGLADKVAIVNQGISGNQLRRDFAGVSAQARFDRDVLATPGVRYVILLEGINDLGFPGAGMGGHLLLPKKDMPTAADIIAAYKQIIARAHAHGLKIIGCTLMPFAGMGTAFGYYKPYKEPVREAINHWIRTSGAFDAVVDFDKVVRDPKKPHVYAPDMGGPLHPNDAGYEAMADAIPLALFK